MSEREAEAIIFEMTKGHKVLSDLIYLLIFIVWEPAGLYCVYWSGTIIHYQFEEWHPVPPQWPALPFTENDNLLKAVEWCKNLTEEI